MFYLRFSHVLGPIVFKIHKNWMKSVELFLRNNNLFYNSLITDFLVLLPITPVVSNLERLQPMSFVWILRGST